MSYCMIHCTVQNKKAAIEIAKNLTKKRLIACCNIIPSVTSIYIWKNKIQEDNEVLMIMKTETELYKQIEIEIKTMHNYDIPEIICTPIIHGNRKYLDWIDEQIIRN